ncbi:MAG: polysaccharide biosynthesis tyrosine autokinase [Syntrophales bacterium]|nr:polysaccharide biosynthesis tyrosine autokinase [Syntrophales bacterium]MDD5531900.1 polysaccharide biosynthesis tyrosine autokinase [Syntrophales bacterium]
MIQYDFNLRDYWRILRKRKILIAFTMVSLGLFSFFFAIISSPVPLYKATASIKIDRSSQMSGLYGMMMPGFGWGQTGEDIQTQVAVLKSLHVVELAAKRLNLIPPNLTSEEIRGNPRYQQIILDLKKRTDAEQEGSSNLINISFTSEEPKFAQKIANTISLVYKDERVLEINRRTFEAKRFIEGQLKVIKEKLRDSEELVREFRAKNKLISLDAQVSSLLGQHTQTKTVYEKVQADKIKVQLVQRALDQAEVRPLTSSNSFYLDEASSLYKALNDKLVQMMLERDTLLLTYTDEYPVVRDLKKKIRETILTMKGQLTSQEKNLDKAIRDLRDKTEDLDNQIQALPEKGLELARLERNVKLNTEVYTLLEQKHQESLIKEAEKIEDVQVVRPALEPLIPINPPKTMETAFVGILLGLILGVVFAFIVETFDTSIGTIEEVEKFLGIPVLGVVPHVSSKEIRESLGDEFAGRMKDDMSERVSRLVSHFAPHSTLAESYRSLRTNLNFACREGDIKTIVFTSATPREGKTTTVVNLAITTAQAGVKVLLVEADLRRPVISGLFGIDQTPGLTDVLLGNYEFKKAVRTIEDIMMGRLNVDDILETPGIDNLNIIPSGTIPLNPSELINSKTLNDFVEWARAEYDVVLIDLPPVLAATDAAILSSKVDGIVLVYRVGRISRNALKRAKAQLDNVKANILGIILNGIRAEISSDFSSFDSDYYYYSEDEKRPRSLKDRAIAAAEAVRNSLFSLLRKKEKSEGEDRKEQQETRESFEMQQEGQSNKALKIALSILAALFLVSGILYQSGYITPKKLLFWRSSGKVVDKGSSVKKPIQEQLPETDPAGPEVKQPQSSPDAQAPVTPSKPEIQASTPAAPPGAAASAIPEKNPSEAAQPPGQKEVPKPEQKAAAAEGSDQAANTTLPGHNYTIQVKAYQDEGETRQLVTELGRKGLKPFRASVNIDGRGVWHRIYVGNFSTRKEAQQYIKQSGMGKLYPDCFVQKVSSIPEKTYRDQVGQE